MVKRQKKLGRALKKQMKAIENLKVEAINEYEGFGKSKVLSFTFGVFYYSDNTTDTQQKINDGYYKTIEEFDSFHTADIEFIDLYTGKDIIKYRNKTKINLLSLGEVWRKRISEEYPEVDITIIVHQNEGEWFLDAFNYPLKIEGGIYL